MFWRRGPWSGSLGAMGSSPKREGKKERRILYRGKALDGSDLQRIRRILRRAKGQNLGEICEAVCRSFGWYRPNGAPRETSVRSLLRRLERRGLIELPVGIAQQKDAGEPGTP